MKSISLLLTFALVSTRLSAQSVAFTQMANDGSNVDKNMLNHLSVGVVAGTTGVGVDFSMPVGDYVQLRAGFEGMPRLNVNVNFPVQGMVKTDDAWQSTNLSKMTDLLTSFTGYDAKDNVDMTCRPLYYNFKFLVDVYPFRNKKWHLTAGFYYGNSKIGEAYNRTEDMPTLFAVGMYNNIYSKVVDDPYYFYDNPLYGDIYLAPDMIERLNSAFTSYGRMGVYVGDYSHDIQAKDENGNLLFEDVQQAVLDDEGNAVLDENGNAVTETVSQPVIAHQKGDPYLMEPDANSMVKAQVKVNRFKPYLGFGYGTDWRNSKSGWGVSFDAGLMFWGGEPSVLTWDGTDLVNDLDNVRGKVGDYVSIIKTFKVFPVLNVRFTKRIF